ncbi:hypothetical protein [Microbacterium sp. CJ88]|uniref:hypothetical protein n=1 Tax=Microbacterium sp. CJ88 TaxID=3445672 RepID=UPI003F65FDFA
MRFATQLVTLTAAMLVLAGCATGVRTAGDGVPVPPSETPVASQTPADPAAQQLQAWIDAATAALPPGAVPAEDAPAAFHSYYGWPCQPALQKDVYWTLPDSTVAATANWLNAQSIPGLVGTTSGRPPIPDDTDYDAAGAGYAPADRTQQGVVFTVAKMTGGVAIRAEVAALTASAVCPSLAPGEMMGLPGQG